MKREDMSDEEYAQAVIDYLADSDRDEAVGLLVMVNEQERKRIEDRTAKRIADWLRRDSTAVSEPAAWDYAKAIERGDWRTK